jgi:hypothetical protein
MGLARDSCPLPCACLWLPLYQVSLERRAGVAMKAAMKGEATRGDLLHDPHLIPFRYPRPLPRADLDLGPCFLSERYKYHTKAGRRGFTSPRGPWTWVTLCPSLCCYHLSLTFAMVAVDLERCFNTKTWNFNHWMLPMNVISRDGFVFSRHRWTFGSLEPMWHAVSKRQRLSTNLRRRAWQPEL